MILVQYTTHTTPLRYILRYLDLLKGILMKDRGIYKTNTPTAMKLDIHMASVTTSINILKFGYHGNTLAGKFGFHGNKIKHFCKMVWRNLNTNWKGKTPSNLVVCVEFEYIVYL